MKMINIAKSADILTVKLNSALAEPNTYNSIEFQNYSKAILSCLRHCEDLLISLILKILMHWLVVSSASSPWDTRSDNAILVKGQETPPIINKE